MKESVSWILGNHFPLQILMGILLEPEMTEDGNQRPAHQLESVNEVPVTVDFMTAPYLLIGGTGTCSMTTHEETI
jgi:hypothetical protein